MVGPMKIIDGFPRRARIDHMVPAEKHCYDAIVEIEKLGADVRLTEAQQLISKAQGLVADVIEEVKR